MQGEKNLFKFFSESKKLNLRNLIGNNNTISNNSVAGQNITNSTDFSEINLISISNSWLGGILSAFGLYVLSVGLTFIVLISHKKTKNTNKQNSFIYFLIALSIGTLIGDAIIHLLPECYGLEEEENESESPKTEILKPNKELVSFFIILGFIIIYVFEKLLLMCDIGHSHGVEDHEHTHHIVKSEIIDISKNAKIDCKKFDKQLENSQDKDIQEKKNNELNKIENLSLDKKINESVDNKIEIKENIAPDEKYSEDQDDGNNKQKNSLKIEEIIREDFKTEKNLKTDNTIFHSEVKKSCCEFLTLRGTKSVGILVVFSEIIHNIIDGIAIGVVFSSRKPTPIISTVIAIILHEIPKELADAGVLIHSNFGFWAILFWNSMSNIGAIFGAIIGLAVSEINKLSNFYLLSVTAGNFLYISLAQLIPILVHVKGKLINFLIFTGIFLGIGIMYLILLLE